MTTIPDIIAEASEVSLITPDRLRNLCAALKLTCGLEGDLAELGVYRGGSARVIAGACSGKTLHLFDTFRGLPYSEDADKDPLGLVTEGRFACSVDEVRERLAGCDVRIYPGRFSTSAMAYEHLRFCFVHVDCDLYWSALDAIEWFWPRVVPGGVMFFDDYNCAFTGVTEAVDAQFTPEQITLQYDAENGIQIGCYVVKEAEGRA